MSDPRSEFLKDHADGEVYSVTPDQVFSIAATLIQLLLTFIEPGKAKELIDKASVARANAIADAAQRAAGL